MNHVYKFIGAKYHLSIESIVSVFTHFKTSIKRFSLNNELTNNNINYEDRSSLIIVISYTQHNT